MKASLAIGAATAVIWGSLYFSANQSFASGSQASAGTTTNTGTTLVAPAQGNSSQQTAQPARVRRTRRS
jgi:hypothetical protein